jgi:hypothetical protein
VYREVFVKKIQYHEILFERVGMDGIVGSVVEG